MNPDIAWKIQQLERDHADAVAHRGGRSTFPADRFLRGARAARTRMLKIGRRPGSGVGS